VVKYSTGIGVLILEKTYFLGALPNYGEPTLFENCVEI
jgi:hypothetical protein